MPQDVFFFQSHFQVLYNQNIVYIYFYYIYTYNTVYFIYMDMCSFYSATLPKQQTGSYPGYQSHANLSTEIEDRSGKWKSVFLRSMKSGSGLTLLLKYMLLQLSLLSPISVLTVDQIARIYVALVPREAGSLNGLRLCDSVQCELADNGITVFF